MSMLYRGKAVLVTNDLSNSVLLGDFDIKDVNSYTDVEPKLKTMFACQILALNISDFIIVDIYYFQNKAWQKIYPITLRKE